MSPESPSRKEHRHKSFHQNPRHKEIKRPRTNQNRNREFHYNYPSSINKYEKTIYVEDDKYGRTKDLERENNPIPEYIKTAEEKVWILREQRGDDWKRISLEKLRK